MSADATEEPQDKTEAPLVTLTVTTRHPWDYVLCNEADGTCWRGTPSGEWKRTQWRQPQ